MNYLFDTNIVSELSKARPNAGVEALAQRLSTHAVSAITMDEIRFGVARIQSIRLAEWADDYFRRHKVHDVTVDIAQRASQMRGNFSRSGISRSQADMLIAATAQAHALTLVTRNTKDFEGCGIGLLNPFDFTP